VSEVLSAVEDVNWLEPNELYFSLGSRCEIDRPLFQGDVITGVPIPTLPNIPPGAGAELIPNVSEAMVMLVPHPCQCYHGDNLRAHLTVAPLKEVPSYDNFGPDRTGAKDKFALPDLIIEDEGDSRITSHVADFGRLVAIPYRYLNTKNRVACLSHMGLGLLAKRLLQFQLRAPSTLANVMAYTQDQWNESFAMQAWVQRFTKLRGFTKWLHSEQDLALISAGLRGIPAEYLTSSLDQLLATIATLDPA
jgi:hypothetical protein